MKTYFLIFCCLTSSLAGADAVLDKSSSSSPFQTVVFDEAVRSPFVDGKVNLIGKCQGLFSPENLYIRAFEERFLNNGTRIKVAVASNGNFRIPKESYRSYMFKLYLQTPDGVATLDTFHYDYRSPDLTPEFTVKCDRKVVIPDIGFAKKQK